MLWELDNMTKYFCNSCGSETIPDGSDVLVVGKLIEPITDLKSGMRRVRETEIHLCSKCTKKQLKEILNAKPEVITKA